MQKLPAWLQARTANAVLLAVADAVLKEALRRYSVVPVVTRSLKEDDTLHGHTVPANTMIVCHVQVSSVMQAQLQPLITAYRHIMRACWHKAISTGKLLSPVPNPEHAQGAVVVTVLRMYPHKRLVTPGMNTVQFLTQMSLCMLLLLMFS